MKVLQYIYLGKQTTGLSHIPIDLGGIGGTTGEIQSNDNNENNNDETIISNNTGERTNTLKCGVPISFGSNGAYRIAFQALPGTLFTLKEGADGSQYNYVNSNDKSIICMGPTGIYELGFTEAIISQFLVIKMVDENSPMILDVLVGEASDIQNSAAITNYLTNLLNESNYEEVNI